MEAKNMRTFIGEITQYDGSICVQVRPNLYYPLLGSSGLAADYREAFGDPIPSDCGRGLWNVHGVLQMETAEQAQARRDGAK